MNNALVFVLIAECWITIGHICFKKSANRLNAEQSGEKPWLIHVLGNIFRYPILWGGALTMLVGLFFWFAALGSGDLSLVYLLGSVQYIFALLAAHFFLQEKINTTKLIGTLLVTLGIILTAAS